jgi:hypothetical protein
MDVARRPQAEWQLTRLCFVGGSDILRTSHVAWFANACRDATAIQSLTTIDFGLHSIGQDGATAAIAWMRVLPKLQCLKLQFGYRVAATGVEEFGPAIMDHPSLTHLEISSTPIGARALTALLPAIQQRLVTLRLHFCIMTDADVFPLFDTLTLSERMQLCYLSFHRVLNSELYVERIKVLKTTRPGLRVQMWDIPSQRMTWTPE